MVAALLLADISGFTAITERLAERGPGGAEELRGLLDGAFQPLLELIAGTGGDVLKFAGDALLACWPAPPGDLEERGLAGATATAAGCAEAMQAALGRFAEAQRLPWPCGSGSGPARWWCWTSAGPATGASCWSPGRRCRRRPGRRAGPARAGGPLPPGPRPGGAGRRPRRRHRPPGGPRGRRRLVAPYLPRAMLASMVAGHEEWLAELRQLTVVFANLPDLDHRAGLDEAQEVMLALQGALYRYEGSINKLSVDEKGTSLVAALGLPPLTHEDDPARGVQAALAIREALAASAAGPPSGSPPARPSAGPSAAAGGASTPCWAPR